MPQKQEEQESCERRSKAEIRKGAMKGGPRRRLRPEAVRRHPHGSRGSPEARSWEQVRSERPCKSAKEVAKRGCERRSRKEV